MSPKSGSNAKPKTPQSPALQHLTAGAKVELMSDDEGFRGSFFSGTVIRRASSKTPTKYLVEYECLFTDASGTKRLREILDMVQIRPLLSPEKKRRTFKFGDEVDAFHNDGWWEGVVTEEAEDGKFSVFFRSTREQIVFGPDSLRVHREWVDGTWKPPLAEEEEQCIKEVSVSTEEEPSEEMECENVEPQKETKKTKSSTEAKSSKEMEWESVEPKRETRKTKSSAESKPSKEMERENVEPKKKKVEPKKETKKTKSSTKATSNVKEVEEVEPKKEPKKTRSIKAVKPESVEPKKEPKKSKASKAKKAEDVELEKEPKKPKAIKATNLKDVEPEKEPKTAEMEQNDAVMEEKFPKGMQVEVTSDEDGFKGAWFVGTIVQPVGEDKYLMQYESLRTEDDTDFEKEEFDILNIRPRPPELLVVDRFKLLEEVDALYNDAWWVGIIVKVLSSKYIVYFKDTQEEIHFKHSDLRPHQDWVDGKWVVPSKALDL